MNYCRDELGWSQKRKSEDRMLLHGSIISKETEKPVVRMCVCKKVCCFDRLWPYRCPSFSQWPQQCLSEAPSDHSSVPVKLPVITAVSHRGFSSFQAEQTKDAHYIWGANLKNCTMSWDTKKLIRTGIKKGLQRRPIQPWVSRSKERRLMGAGVKHVRPFGLNLTGRYVSS